MALSYEMLRDAVAGGAVGATMKAALRPLGGAGDKVFPPTYAVDDKSKPQYAIETRRAGGQSIASVALDSVGSQANRIETALLEAVRDGSLRLPITSVDFRSHKDLADLDLLSELEAPHRIFDAILRDSMDANGGAPVLFRLGAIGRAITEAAPRRATQLFVHSPVTLVLGGWDSTGPKGGRGAKYERALASEITAYGIELGAKTSSRIDPLGIELKGTVVYESTDAAEGWTLDPAAAVQEKGKPKQVRPSETNHGNIAPSIDIRAGGVTADAIRVSSVLSFIQLRRLKFPVDASGLPLADRPAAELAARTALAAIGLAGVILSVETGYDLRSRCVLVADGEPVLEMVGRTGSTTPFALSGTEATALVEEAAAAAAVGGLAWRAEELLLEPTPRLVELTRASRRAATGAITIDSSDTPED